MGIMKCNKHHRKDAITVCSVCGSGLCKECDNVYKSIHYCKDCREHAVKNANKKISAERDSLQSKISLLNVLSLILGVIIFILICIAIGINNLAYNNDPMVVDFANRDIYSIKIYVGLLIGGLIVLLIFRRSIKKKKELLKDEV